MDEEIQNSWETQLPVKGSFQSGDLFTEEELKLMGRKRLVARRAQREFPRGGYEGLDNLELKILISTSALCPTTPGVVADDLGLDRSTVSRPLTNLLKRGLVSEEPDGKDGRRKLLSPTRDGAKMLKGYLAG